jgi:acyl-CoA thioesterase-1
MRSILFLGDSFTQGWGLDSHESMPSIIQELLGKEEPSDWVCINAGLPGDTSGGGLARLPLYLKPASNLRAAVIEFGTNDVLHGIETEKIRSHLSEIVKILKLFDPSLCIVLMEMGRFPGLPVPHGYEEMFAELASEEGIALVPNAFRGIAGERGYVLEDGIHPNGTAMEIIADRVYQILRPLIAEPGPKAD